MNLPTEKLYSLGRHKMFKCWKCSSSDPELIEKKQHHNLADRFIDSKWIAKYS